MARSGKTAQEFIQGAFSPTIGVLCGPSVNNVLSKNNLTFTELLQPFTTMNWEGQLREPGGSVCTVKNWKLVIKDVNWRPLQPTEARRQLNNSALLNYNDNCVSLEIDGRQFEIPQFTPWFDAWRDTYLEVQFPSDHEFTKTFISTILVVTSHDDQIINATTNSLKRFVDIIKSTPAKLPIWFNSDMPSCYVMLHDVSAVPKEIADEKFLIMQRTYGANKVFMLPINSKTVSEPHLPVDYWAPYIRRTSDMNNDVSSSLSNVQTSPMESQPSLPPQSSIFPPPNSEDNPIISAIQEVLHPLTATDNDVYDNGNSLQTHSFSGSSESMNVAGRTEAEIHGAALNANDVDAIKNFLKEYCSKELLPHIEKLIAEISEVVANRKGVSRSLFSATKRWFGTGKGGNTTGNNAVVYTSECPELQLRRLGDLWFLCGQWQRAFDVYHTAKREFYADSAWLCYAGALEMAALSAFMAGEASRKTHAYMEESIITYLNTCRMVQYAVRATLFSVVCLSGSGLHGEAAKQLIRMTSEDSDLRSAMLLEQASLCFFAGPGSKAMARKYAFHMVLAGHRFSKAGQKRHAYRCYEQAYQVYSDSGWRLATDHVQFALGRLAGALKQPREAASWLAAPLAPSARQPARQQDAFLKEYMLAHQQWVDQSEEFKYSLPVLPLPLLQNECTAVLCVGPAPLSSPGRLPATSITVQDINTKQDDLYWHKLEEMLLQVAQGSVPMIFKPTVDLYTVKTDRNPTVPQGEPIQISITLWNPLKITLAMKDVELLWKFLPSTQSPESPKGDVLNNESAVASGSVLESNVICGQKIKSVLWGGDCKKVLTFTLTPLQVGQLSIHGVSYKLINMGEEGNENSGAGVTILGKLNLGSGVNSTDKCLQINVMPYAPCLQMTFSESSLHMISGEIQEIDVEFRNVGSVDMRNIYIAVSHPDCVTLLTPDEGEDHFRLLYEDKYQEQQEFQDERAGRALAWRSASARHVSRVTDRIPRGGHTRARLLLRPTLRPRTALQLLAYYEGEHNCYRLLRHVFRFHVTEAVEVSVTPRRSLRKLADDIMENMSLAIEIKNVSSEKDEDTSIEVLEASLLSRQWKLTDLTIANRGDLLTCRERLHLVLRAKRILNVLPKNFVDYSCVKVAEDQPDSDNDINIAPYSKFVTEFKPYIENCEVTEPHKINNESGLIQSMFVVRWKAYDKKNKRIALGQHCLWLECFKKTESHEKHHVLGELPTLQLEDYDKLDITESKSKNVTTLEDDVVVLGLEHSNLIYHNFEQTKLCFVPITLNIVNCYGDPVKIFINLSKQQNGESKGELGWVGALSNGSGEEANDLGVSVNLDKFEARRVQLSALCAEPGTYPVGSSFAVTSTRGQEIAQMHFANNTSLLVVQQAA